MKLHQHRRTWQNCPILEQMINIIIIQHLEGSKALKPNMFCDWLLNISLLGLGSGVKAVKEVHYLGRPSREKSLLQFGHFPKKRGGGSNPNPNCSRHLKKVGLFLIMFLVGVQEDMGGEGSRQF